jgi:hypothetical protein
MTEGQPIALQVVWPTRTVATPFVGGGDSGIKQGSRVAVQLVLLPATHKKGNHSLTKVLP